MEKEKIKQLMDVMQAYVNGKTIQYYDVDYSFKIAHPGERNFNNKWVDVDEEHLFRPDMYDYRVKPEPKYRPFKDADECWKEMLKHQPFGWVKSKKSGTFYSIGSVLWDKEFDDVFVTFAYDGMLCRSSKSVFEDFTFLDGTPFGIKEE